MYMISSHDNNHNRKSERKTNLRNEKLLFGKKIKTFRITFTMNGTPEIKSGKNGLKNHEIDDEKSIKES